MRQQLGFATESLRLREFTRADIPDLYSLTRQTEITEILPDWNMSEEGIYDRSGAGSGRHCCASQSVAMSHSAEATCQLRLMGSRFALIYTLEAVPVGKYSVKCAESAIRSDGTEFVQRIRQRVSLGRQCVRG